MVMLSGQLEVIVVESQQYLPSSCRFSNLADEYSYCSVELKTDTDTILIGQTPTIDDTINPKWFYRFTNELKHDVVYLNFIVKCNEIVAYASFYVKELLANSNFEGFLNLQNSFGEKVGRLFVIIGFSGGTDFLLPKKINNIAYTSRKSSKSQSAHKMAIFLHGSLHIFVERASGIPNLDNSFLSLNKKDVSDPYVVVNLHDSENGSFKVATTSVIDNNLNPIWNEKFEVEICHNITSISFDVRDKDFVSSEIIGSVSLPGESILNGDIKGTFDLRKDNVSKNLGKLTLSVSYKNKSEVAGSNNPEVSSCLFPMRCNNFVTLYQDTHCPSLPLQVTSYSGYPHCPRSTWRDIYETITNAQIFIYIVGWSVSVKIPLLRWPGEDSTPLGHLLLAKANEGVRVRILLWDELTSNDLRKQGAMSTEDEDTFSFFRGTPVVVKLAPRDRYTKDMFSTKNPFTKLCYTHHQKCVIADKESIESQGERHIAAFVGGLDLTGGRFDTPEHPLFKTLISEHKNDFRNRMHMTSSSSGPREPWHDIHSCVEGPIAIDILQNFQERWNKQGDKDNNIYVLQSNSVLNLNYEYKGNHGWNVQMFRSINSDSAIFDWQTSIGSGLTNKKGRAFDNSIHRAYIHQIRRAKRFIYIENQYFLGSSHAWLDCRDAGAENLIPLEIAIKIEDKINAKERFVAYIVVPMFPEGKPAEKVTQEILHWQFRTMQMMYDRIGKAIVNNGIDAHPQDYLLFLCLAKKEDHDTVPPELIAPEDPAAAAAFEHRRLMIYVHSKMAIFDDEYVIIGSANINDRSMSGNRDTEIAVGSYQPSFLADDSNTPYGNVAIFRCCLWSEHMGRHAPIKEDPASQACVRKVQQLAENGLKAYADDSVFSLDSHLLMYPLQVDQNGRLDVSTNCPFIPDTSASCVGARSKVFPSSLTT